MNFFGSKTKKVGKKIQKCFIQWQQITRNANLNVGFINKEYNQIKKGSKMSSAVQQIKKRINEATKNDSKFTDLDLSQIQIGKFTPQINALLQKCKKLEVLYLIECGLTTLEGFPNLKLVGVDLSKNKIGDDGHIEVLLNSSELTQLIFAQNNIAKIETVLKLSPLQKLLEIDFTGNPVTEDKNYPAKIFEKFKSMQYVDTKDKDGKQQPQEGEEEVLDDDEDEEQYDEDDEQQQFDQEEDYEEEEESEEKPKKGGRKKK